LLYNTDAIVIRSISYGETHAIVTLLTPSGTVAAMARGAKKPQSRLAAGIQLCVQGIFTVSQGKGMGTVQQLEIVQSRRVLREQLDLAAYAAYFSELVNSVAEPRPGGSEAVYRLFLGALDRLQAQTESPRVIARVWEAKVLVLLGASPDWTRCVRCGSEDLQAAIYIPQDGGIVCARCFAASSSVSDPRRVIVPSSLPKILHYFSTVPWDRIGQIRVSAETLKVLEQVLKIQLSDYGGLYLKSRAFLESLTDLFEQ
jgi:DNA repair protein RecO (recombination protein O)